MVKLLYQATRYDYTVLHASSIATDRQMPAIGSTSHANGAPQPGDLQRLVLRMMVFSFSRIDEEILSGLRIFGSRT